MIGGVLLVSDSKTNSTKLNVSSFACVLASAFCYQQFTALAVLPVAIWSAVQFIENKSFQIKKIVTITSYVVLALLLNAIYVFVNGDGAQDRVLGGTISERIHWFSRVYTPRTIDLFLENSFLSGVVSLGIVILILGLPALFNIRYLAFSVAAIISWGACAAVAFPTQFWASYRLIHPAQVALWSVVAFSLAYLAAHTKAKAIGAMLILPVVFACFITEERARLYVATPNHVDWVSTKCKVLNNPSVNTFVVNEWNSSLSDVHLYDEYGMVASNFDWTLALSIDFARRELNDTGSVGIELLKPILISKSDTSQLKPDTYIIIDHKGC